MSSKFTISPFPCSKDEYISAISGFVLAIIRTQIAPDFRQKWVDEEDIMQEALAAIAKMAEDVVSEDKWLLKSYVYTIVKNRRTDLVRKRDTQIRGGNQHHEALASDVAATARRSNVNEDEVEDLNSCMSTLSEKERCVVQVKYCEATSDETIAELLGDTKQNIHVVRSRAMKKLRECMAKRQNLRVNHESY